VLSVEQISSRLAESFRLLKSEMRTRDPRQQTLGATIDWSHELLDEPERALFRRLSVFVGGFDLGAAERVCSAGDIEKDEVLDLLARLVAERRTAGRGRGSRPAADGGAVVVLEHTGIDRGIPTGRGGATEDHEQDGCQGEGSERCRLDGAVGR